MDDKNQKLYIIPGFNETTNSLNYQEIIEYASKFNFEIMPITINWQKQKKMSDYIEQAKEQLPDQSTGYLLGFSFGAYIAYSLSKQKKFNGYIFCTISPYFKNNLKNIPTETRKFWGNNFLQDLKYLENNSLHKGNNSVAWFLVGQKDWPMALETNQKASEKWSGEHNYIVVRNASHELAHENYVGEVCWILKNLNRNN